jgi:hypothetical protein
MPPHVEPCLTLKADLRIGKAMKKQIIGLNAFLIHKNNHDNIKITFIKQPNVLIKSGTG